MPRTPTITPEQEAEIVRLHHESEMGGRAIADYLQISYGKVRGALERSASQRTGSSPDNAEVPQPVNQGSPSVGAPGPAVRVAVWDIETTDFKSDIGRLTVSSFYYPDTNEVHTRTFKDFPDGERGLAVWTMERITELDFIIGHNHKAFDRNFLNGVLARHDAGMLPRRGWWDTYLIARYGLKGNMGTSMANLADIFQLGDGKYKPSKNDWRNVLVDPDSLEEIARRCEEDVKLNWLIFLKLKPYLHKWLHKNEG